jgi:hypothetical protein
MSERRHILSGLKGYPSIRERGEVIMASPLLCVPDMALKEKAELTLTLPLLFDN